jgi:hypothetical protein
VLEGEDLNETGVTLNSVFSFLRLEKVLAVAACTRMVDAKEPNGIGTLIPSPCPNGLVYVLQP